MIAVVDCGPGKISGIGRLLDRLGVPYRMTDDPDTILASDGVILAGTGTFGDGMRYLVSRRLDDVLWEVSLRDIPLLGVGLGMHLLFTEGEENGLHRGLNMLAGTVKRLPDEVNVPHVGWNELILKQPHRLFRGITDGYAYFSHTYYTDVANREDVLAMTDSRYAFPAIVGRRQTFGMQFYPEISGELGEQLITRFASICHAFKKECVS